MGCGASKTSAQAIQRLDEVGDFLPTRFKASRKLTRQVGGVIAVTVTIRDESNHELLTISSSHPSKCIIAGKADLKFSKGTLACGDAVLYKARQSLVTMTDSLSTLINFERVAATRTEGGRMLGDVTCATFKDSGRHEYVVYNQRFASTAEAAQAISRSAVIARATVEKHVYDRAKLTPVNGKVRLAASDLPFQTKGVAIETELCLPREVADGEGGDTQLAASLFFAALPLLDTSKDGFYGEELGGIS